MAVNMFTQVMAFLVIFSAVASRVASDIATLNELVAQEMTEKHGQEMTERNIEEMTEKHVQDLNEKIALELEAEQDSGTDKIPTMDRAEEIALFRAKQAAQVAKHSAEVMDRNHDAQVVAFKVAQLIKKGMDSKAADALVRRESVQATQIKAMPNKAMNRAEVIARFRAEQAAQVAKHDAKVEAFKAAQLTKKGMDSKAADAEVRTDGVQADSKAADAEVRRDGVQARKAAQSHDAHAKVDREVRLARREAQLVRIKHELDMENQKPSVQVIEIPVKKTIDIPVKDKVIDIITDAAMTTRENLDSPFKKLFDIPGALTKLRKSSVGVDAAAKMREAFLSGLAIWGAVAIAQDAQTERPETARIHR